jgi:DNA-binding PadR family transcriptional regulator
MPVPSERVLTELVLEVLTAGPRTGFEIAGDLQSEFGTTLRGREGALYATLLRMEREGFVIGDWQPREGAERRRVYQLPVLVDLDALTGPESPE